MIEFGIKIRKCRHGKATYIFVPDNTPDKLIDDNFKFYGPCTNCISKPIFKGIKRDIYHPYMCHLCKPHDIEHRGHWEIYSIGRLSREKIIYKEKE